MKKIKGFTTMELSIVMLMAGLIASMAYGGYTLFTKQFYSYSAASEEALKTQQLAGLMKRDVDACTTMYSHGSTLDCMNEKNNISWSFENENYVLRTQGYRSDTFYITLKTYQFSLMNKPNGNSKNLADAVSFSAYYKNMEVAPAFKKQYSNKTLMEFNETHGH